MVPKVDISAQAVLRNIAQTSNMPLLFTIAALSASIFNLVRSVKSHKQECTAMVEHIDEILSTIIRLTSASETDSPASPDLLRNIESFTETLKTVYVFVEAQQGMGMLRRFFLQGDNATQLEKCKAGLRRALDIFIVRSGVATTLETAHVLRNSKRQHAEILDLLANRSESTLKDDSSSVTRDLYGLANNSSNLSLLPASPKIFHGRETELDHVTQLMCTESPRVAILGPGGIGKTSLATAVLHHPKSEAKFAQRYFVSCESAPTYVQLVSLLATYIGVKSGGNEARAICKYFSKGPTTLLVLDNMETTWEPLDSRGKVEEFLSLLADVPHLALLITMRGAERPDRVRWSRPFLLPLKPLTRAAAIQTFVDIADDIHSKKDTDVLLSLTGNLPLSITLIANAVAFEGCETVVTRWKSESTALLSEAGRDKRSNLDLSITLSLSSPRMLDSPGSQHLLGLLSLLPDGISDVELFAYKLPIQHVAKSRATLIRTSLAYVAPDGRLNILVPIREHMRTHHPPHPNLVLRLRSQFHQLLGVWKDYRDVPLGVCVPQLTANLNNIHDILAAGLHSNSPDLKETIESVLTLNMFTRNVGKGVSRLMQDLPDFVEQTGDPQLRGAYIGALFTSWPACAITNPEALMEQGIQSFKMANDPAGEARFYLALGVFFIHQNENLKCIHYSTLGLNTSKTLGHTVQQSLALRQIAQAYHRLGNHVKAKDLAHDSQKLAKLCSHLSVASHAMFTESLCCKSLGDFASALGLIQEARQLLEVCGLKGGDKDLLLVHSEAEILFLKTDYVQARRLHMMLAENSSPEATPIQHFYALINIACIDLEMDAEVAQVQEGLNTARAVCESLPSRYPRGMQICDIMVARLHLRQGQRTESRRMYEDSFTSLQCRDNETSLLCLRVLGDPTNSLGTLQETFRWAIVFLAVGLRGRDNLAICQALRCLADILVQQAEEGTALALLEISLQGFTAMDVHRGRAECLYGIGGIWDSRGEPEKAVELWQMARRLFEMSSQSKKVDLIDTKLNHGTLATVIEL